MRQVVLAFALAALAIAPVLATTDVLFQEVHVQVVRLVRNEAGMRSIRDADGIFHAMKPQAVDDAGVLHFDRLLSRMVRHSPRTFPLDSRWRSYVDPKKLRHRDKLRTKRNAITSSINLSCEKPAAWKARDDGKWSIEACFEMVDYTRKLLRGQAKSYCKGSPTTWGSCEDVEKRQIRGKMKEIICDRPRARVPGNTVSCPELRADCTQEGRRRLANARECTKNFFWRWQKRR